MDVPYGMARCNVVRRGVMQCGADLYCSTADLGAVECSATQLLLSMHC
jgi:hypothetical protein